MAFCAAPFSAAAVSFAEWLAGPWLTVGTWSVLPPTPSFCRDMMHLAAQLDAFARQPNKARPSRPPPSAPPILPSTRRRPPPLGPQRRPAA